MKDKAWIGEKGVSGLEGLSLSPIGSWGTLRRSKAVLRLRSTWVSPLLWASGFLSFYQSFCVLRDTFWGLVKSVIPQNTGTP